MSTAIKVNFRKPKARTSVLGLTLDGSRLDGVVLRRTNGALQKLQSFSVTLALDPMTAAPELVGREIRNHLDAVGVRERHCVVGLPLKWVLATHTELPKLSAEDAANLLQLEAERAFPSDPATLQLANSFCALADGRQYVTLTGIANSQLTTLEQVLAAAKLKPVSFALRLAALQPPADKKSDGVLALMVGENQVGLQITSGGGVTALRALDGVIENEPSHRVLHTKLVAREARITLGQLPAELRAAVKSIRIFGARDLAQQLADEMILTFEPMGLEVDLVTTYAPTEFGVQLPPEAPLSGAFSLAARALVGQPPALEYLPPKPTAWQQFTSRYASGQRRTIGLAAAAVLLLIFGAFAVQQIQLTLLRSRWNRMATQVHELEGVRQQIAQYRPWFDDSFRSLSILKEVTLAFPQDGVVTAKSIDIRDGSVVSCSGNARDQASFLKTYSQLRAATNVAGLKADSMRGKTPMQFTFTFRWNEGGGHEN
jgi:hypothetical protein